MVSLVIVRPLAASQVRALRFPCKCGSRAASFFFSKKKTKNLAFHQKATHDNSMLLWTRLGSRTPSRPTVSKVLQHLHNNVS